MKVTINTCYSFLPSSCAIVKILIKLYTDSWSTENLNLGASQGHFPGLQLWHRLLLQHLGLPEPGQAVLPTHLHEFLAFQKIILQHLLGKAPHSAVEFICCFTTFYLPR